MSSDSTVSLEQAATLLFEHGKEITKLLHEGKLRALEGTRIVICSKELETNLALRREVL